MKKVDEDLAKQACFARLSLWDMGLDPWAGGWKKCFECLQTPIAPTRHVMYYKCYAGPRLILVGCVGRPDDFFTFIDIRDLDNKYHLAQVDSKEDDFIVDRILHGKRSRLEKEFIAHMEECK